MQRRRRAEAFPAPLSSFVGRRDERAALEGLLASGARLVTLTGPGGIGKTRLATEVGRGMIRDGVPVVLCDLSETFTRVDLVSRVATALGASGGPMAEKPLAAHVGASLAREGKCFVVLDNFEQLASHASVLGAWLEAASEAVFLVTSRERLHVPGEHVLELLPLGHVGAGIEGDPRDCDAVRLLVERGRASSARFTLADEDLPAAAAIVRALDGIPLAIELCAARLGVLGVRQLRDQLAESALATTVSVRAPSARHATMRGAIEWSWRLLDPEARATLARCSVFHGGFKLDAVRSVLALPANAGGTAAALDAMQALHDRSLVRMLDGANVAERRFTLYETVREYAAMQLEASQERSAVAALHAAHYLAVGERLATEADGPRGVEAREELAREVANLWAIAREPASPADGLRALLAMESLYSERGPIDPYAEALDRAIAAAEEPSARSLRARAVLVRGRLDITRGAFDDAIAHFARAREEAAALSDRGLGALAASKLAVIGAFRDLDVESTFAEAERLAREVGDPRLEGICVSDRASARSRAGQELEALRDREHTVRCFDRAGDARRHAVALGFLGSSCLATGQTADAERHTLAAAHALRAFGDTRTEGQVLGFLARARHQRGATAEARAVLATALDALVRVGERWFEGVYRGWLGDLHLDDDRTEDAVTAYGHAIAILEPSERPYASLFRAALDVARVTSDRAALCEPIPLSGLPATIASAVRLHRAHVDVLRGDTSTAGDALEAAEATRGLSDDVRFAERMLRRAIERAPRDDADNGGLTIGPAARWFRRGSSPRVELERHRGLRLVLLRLVEARMASPGTSVSRPELIAAGWPGELIRPTAAMNRLNVSLSRLKRLGLRDLVRTRDDGVLLDPAIPCSVKKD